MIYTWRWFGEDDPVTLQDIRKIPVTGIVSALHHLENGLVWPVDEIRKRKKKIEENGFNWEVVESVPIHEDIKMGISSRDMWIEQFLRTLQNLAACNISTVCYNFMPVLDWMRTNPDYQLQGGAGTLRFDMTELALFDLLVLQRKDAANDYSLSVIQAVERHGNKLDDKEKRRILGLLTNQLPGAEEKHSLEILKEKLEIFKALGHEGLQSNLLYFLDAVVPEAEKLGIRLAIHPDDPPWDILGLPRIISNEQQLDKLFSRYIHRSNGLAFCSGSLGAGKNNDVIRIFNLFADRIYFLHLRNVVREPDGSFYESGHLEGDLPIRDLIQAIRREEERREEEGEGRREKGERRREKGIIPVRADHGLNYSGTSETNPGYGFEGRARGLNEIRQIDLSST